MPIKYRNRVFKWAIGINICGINVNSPIRVMKLGPYVFRLYF